MAKFNSISLLLFIVSVTVPSLVFAHIVDVEDKYWVSRSNEAWNNTLKAYEIDPLQVTHHVNKHANLHLEDILAPPEDGDHSRRELRGDLKGAACMAANPIDGCWRCNSNWAQNRFRLADCVMGFGRKTTGGKNGKIYIVTDSSDNDVKEPKNGTLRHAVIQKEPLWIIFQKDMMIKLNQELMMQGDKTIDARGANVHIAYGAGIMIQFVKNVIIHGLHIHDIVQGNGGLIRDSVDHFGFRGQSDGDGISIFGSSNVWVDHVSMWNCYDGLVDAIEGSTAITISNSHFTDHNDVMLFGASDSQTKDVMMQVTVAFNHYGKRLIQRMPRIRFGYAHVVNNDYTHWEMFAIGGSSHPTIVSQGNRFVASNIQFKKEVTKRDFAPESVWKNWNWRSQGDLLENGAFFVQSGDPQYVSKHPELYDGIQVANGNQVPLITKFAGALACYVGQKC